MGYVKGQMADHAMTADMYEMHSKSSKDGDARAYVKKVMSIVERHYDMTKMMDMRMHMAMMPMMKAGR
jgi:hypothetical protein